MGDLHPVPIPLTCGVVLRNAGLELGCSESVFEDVINYVSEDHSIDDESSESGMSGVEYQLPTPSKIILRWYEESTTLMHQLKQNPKSHSVKKKLDAINARIKEKNEEEGQKDPKLWFIQYKDIAAYYQDAKAITASVKEDLDNFLARHHYPRSWTLEVVQHQEGTPAQNTQQPQPSQNISNNQTTLPVWKPGLTGKGERILGMQPNTRTDVDDNSCLIKCTFLVEKKGQKNPMAFEDSGRIGKKASQGYRNQLPEREQRDVRTTKYTSSDQEGFVRIKAVAAKRGTSRKIYPYCCVWAEHEGTDDKIVNRTAFRKIWGSEEADRMIEDFYNEHKLAIPWEKRAKRPERQRSSRRKRRASIVSVASSTTGSTYSSGDSVASFISNARSERAQGIEDRMASLERLIGLMSQKLDRL